MVRRVRGSLLGALALAIGCSLVVPAELDQIRCSQPGAVGPPACDPGFVCAQGVCQSCLQFEICGDGIDNDCNGGIDDGCATAGSSGFGAGSGGALPDGSAGNGTGGGSGDGGGGSGGGLGGESGSSGGASGASGVGTPCPLGNECAAGDFCADAASFGLTPGKVCTRGCCKTDECGPDNVCYPTMGGNSLCFPSALAGRPTGSGLVGTACAGHGDCRTGLCFGAVCTDVCCANSDCPANIGACQLNDIGDRKAFICAPAAGGGDYNSNCWNGSLSSPAPVPSVCASRVCVQSQYVFPPFTCSKTCCRAADCSDGLTCRYQGIGQPTVKYCRLPAAGTGQTGDPCAVPGDCRSGLCLALDGGGSVCTEACCRDADCGAPGQFACRPGVLSGIAHLICVKL
jgi:hypothetical protein